MNPDTLSLDARLDELFGYPERASLNCPPGARARLKGLLESDSELVFRAPGLVAWMGMNGPLGWVNYMAASADRFAAEAPRFLPYFKRLGEEAGLRQFHLYAGSEAAEAALAACGLKRLHDTVRMRREGLAPMAADAALRPITAADEEAVLDLMQASFPDQDTSRETWRACIHANWQAWLAEVEGVPAGYILVDATQRTLMVNGLGVSPHHQGHGLGRRLMNKVADLAVANGKEAIEVLADAKPGVIRFYENLGFARVHDAFYMVQVLGPTA